MTEPRFTARRRLTAKERQHRVRELQAELDRQAKRFGDFLKRELSTEPQQKRLFDDETQ